jgi:hypothetical protein
MHLLATIDAFVPILHSLFWCVVWLAVFLFFRKRLSAIADIIELKRKAKRLCAATMEGLVGSSPLRSVTFRLQRKSPLPKVVHRK